MMNRYVAFIVLLTGIGFSCQRNYENNANQFSAIALRGKAVFEKHECGRCHYVGDEEIKAEAPDLSKPMLANDSLFVQTHLKFVQLSQMPQVNLTEVELRQLGYYIAELHRNKYAKEVQNPNGICAVCYAPVNRSETRETGLYRVYRNTYYHFECEECLKTFEQAPDAFVELLQQYKQHQATELASSM